MSGSHTLDLSGDSMASVDDDISYYGSSTASSDSDDDEEELVMDLQLSAKRLLRRASRTGVKLADQDAAEAHAIYMESLPPDQVQTYFGRKDPHQHHHTITPSLLV